MHAKLVDEYLPDFPDHSAGMNAAIEIITAARDNFAGPADAVRWLHGRNRVGDLDALALALETTLAAIRLVDARRAASNGGDETGLEGAIDGLCEAVDKWRAAP
jgi:hypothetical protein